MLLQIRFVKWVSQEEKKDQTDSNFAFILKTNLNIFNYRGELMEDLNPR